MVKFKNTACIILAAGRGTRMKSSLPKVLHKISGKTMIEHILDTIRPFGLKPTIVIAGYKGREVAKFAKGSRVITQERLLGSANAVMKAQGALKKFAGDVLVLYGDAPLIKRDTVRRLIAEHKATKSACTLLTATLKNPAGYGRIFRDDSGDIIRIIEENEASLYDRTINEVNVGTCCFDSKRLFEAAKEVKADNRKKEYYLTNVISILRGHNLKIESVSTDNEEEALGVNSREELSMAESIMNRIAIKKFMANGVTVVNPSNICIESGATIGGDTIIKPFTVIEGDVKIGSNCTIGPFARLRPGTILADGVEIGNFVELTRSNVGRNTKIKHHSYIGDSVIGENVNIGAGTITANYDGKDKYKTVIKDGAFIGSGTIFVAPVTVGKKAITGAGSVLTRKTVVPDNSVVVGIPARILRKRRKS